MPTDNPKAAALAALHALLADLARAGILPTEAVHLSVRDDLVEARLHIAPRRDLTRIPQNLPDIMANVLEAIGAHHMSARELAVAAGYRLNSHFRKTLADMVRRGLLERGPAGYRRP